MGEEAERELRVFAYFELWVEAADRPEQGPAQPVAAG
jgi:hypothetical protein